MSEIVIEAKELTKQYKKQKAVDSVSFQIRKGMICGLVGPNGAGKTTIMKMLGGLVLPTGGSFSLTFMVLERSSQPRAVTKLLPSTSVFIL